ncbi:unnamed protein product [Anisakis simplex]|uniref:C-type lectin domain-containing protein n=1 Tax=Anisakis simplex TaxID=6269 RepID=A0A3P6TF24_ANISI|nr:unnamed protein product [Anisakis simplex]
MTTFRNEQHAIHTIKKLMRKRKKLPVGDGMNFNVGMALLTAHELLQREARAHQPAMVILFSATDVTCRPLIKNGRQHKQRYGYDDPCQVSVLLNEENNVLATVGFKFGGVGYYPKIEIAKHCYAINNTINLSSDLKHLICQANCFCPPPYVQYKNTEQCVNYRECVFAHAIALPHEEATRTCQDDEAELVNIFDALKQQFVDDLHQDSNYIPYWIGLNQVNGEMCWPLGEKVVSFFKNLFSSLPEDDSDDSAVVSLSAQSFSLWNDTLNVNGQVCVIAKVGADGKTSWVPSECTKYNANYFSCQKSTCDTDNGCVVREENYDDSYEDYYGSDESSEEDEDDNENGKTRVK